MQRESGQEVATRNAGEARGATSFASVETSERLFEDKMLLEPLPFGFTPTVDLPHAKTCLKRRDVFRQYVDIGGEIKLGLLTYGGTGSSVDSGTADPPYVRRPAYVVVARYVPQEMAYLGPSSGAASGTRAPVDAYIVCDAMSAVLLLTAAAGDYYVP